jgi:hypothetical protein
MQYIVFKKTKSFLLKLLILNLTKLKRILTLCNATEKTITIKIDEHEKAITNYWTCSHKPLGHGTT